MMNLYKLTNLVNGKRYIGTSVNPVSHRVSRHLYAAKAGRDNGMAITRAIRKYGLETFLIETIGTASTYDELMNMERQAIKEYNTSIPNGYNISSGGVGACRPCSPETRLLIASRLRGRHPWNFGKRNANTIARYERTGHIGGPKPGTPSPKKGIKTGPLSEAHRAAISAGVQKVRATQFWSSKKKETI